MFDWKAVEERGTRWANILAIIPGSYCAFGTYIALHSRVPESAPRTAPPAQVLSFVGGLDMKGVIVSLGVFVACIAVGAVLNTLAASRVKRLNKPEGRVRECFQWQILP
jgi:hypothetical protein